MLIRSGESPILSEIIGANRARIGKHIENFHNQAGTVGPNIDRCITALKSPSTEILVSIHQPNLFAFAGVFKKIILLQCLKSIAERRNSTRKFVNLFLIVDHDFMDDFWIRHAQLPSLRHSNGILDSGSRSELTIDGA